MISHPAPIISRRQLLQAALILTGASTVALSGCSSREVQDTSATNSSGATNGNFNLTVVDQRNRSVTFDAPVERIATTVIPAPSMLIAADQGISKIVAVNKVSQTQAENGFLTTMFPDIMHLPVASAGTDFVPNIETINSASPDVVIQWGDRGDDIVTPIEQAGLKVLLLQYGTQEDLEYWVDMLTKLVGKPERGEKIIQTMHKDRAAVEKVTKAAGTKPRTLCLWSYEEMKVSANNSYMDFWINLCGGENVGRAAGDGSSIAINREELISWDPEVIFIGNFSKATPKTLFDDPFFADVAAVKNRRVYKIPNGGFAWDPPCNESNLMWQWAVSLIHPQKAEFELRSAMHESYEYLYAHKLSDKEIAEILRIEANRDSADYDRFDA